VAFISVYSKSFRTKVLPELRVLSITHRMKKIITGTKIKTVHGVGYRLEVLWG